MFLEFVDLSLVKVEIDKLKKLEAKVCGWCNHLKYLNKGFGNLHVSLSEPNVLDSLPSLMVPPLKDDLDLGVEEGCSTCAGPAKGGAAAARKTNLCLLFHSATTINNITTKKCNNNNKRKQQPAWDNDSDSNTK